mgnify:CR=1 FL=1
MSEPIITSSGVYYNITLEENELDLIIECLKKEATTYSFRCPINAPRIDRIIREIDVVRGVDRLQTVTNQRDKSP